MNLVHPLPDISVSTSLCLRTLWHSVINGANGSNDDTHHGANDGHGSLASDYNDYSDNIRHNKPIVLELPDYFGSPL